MKNLKKIVTLLLVLATVFCFIACTNNNPTGDLTPTPTIEANTGIKKEGLWATALYTEDTILGEGSKTLNVIVKVEEQSVTFTIKTDKKTVGEALLEHSLIAGEEGAYGLYVKSVNGIKADYDTDKAYWGFFQNGEYMMTGVDTTNFESGQSYELVYTKG